MTEEAPASYALPALKAKQLRLPVTGDGLLWTRLP
jgi:hypothetical protein